jgi:dual-specificity kinase
VWSIGCIVVELVTGELYFETHENLEHLRMMEKHAGPFPEWMINRSSEFRDSFQNGRISARGSASSLQRVARMKTLRELFAGQPDLLDLLGRCLELDPRRRISCAEALQHRFFG